MKKYICVLLITLICSLAYAEELKLVGSLKSKTYHYATCRYAKKINESYIVIFKSVDMAKRTGYQPCKICKPEDK